MNRSARMAIEALRNGVPNSEAIRLMHAGQSDLERAFMSQLQSVTTDGNVSNPGFGIAGGFGTGKSHFLGYLADIARAQGFVVSRIVVSKETPLSDPQRVFEAAARTAVLPDRTDEALLGALGILRQSSEKMAKLERAIEQKGPALAPVFSTLILLMKRDTTPPGFIRRLVAFLAGSKLGVSFVRQILKEVVGRSRYDLRFPSAAELTSQRIIFVAAIYRAAGYSGWCLLFDEVELIGRYTPARRAMAYAWLSNWMGLPGAYGFEGVTSAYAITDDFVAAVIDEKKDKSLVITNLRKKGLVQEAGLAKAAMSHIALTVRSNRLPVLGSEGLSEIHDRLVKIYRLAYENETWQPPAFGLLERTASRTVRQYIKSWITLWDMQRLTGDEVKTIIEVIRPDYDEDPNISSPNSENSDPYSE